MALKLVKRFRNAWPRRILWKTIWSSEFKVADIVNDEFVLEAAHYEATDLLMEETF